MPWFIDSRLRLHIFLSLPWSYPHTLSLVFKYYSCVFQGLGLNIAFAIVILVHSTSHNFVLHTPHTLPWTSVHLNFISLRSNLDSSPSYSHLLRSTSDSFLHALELTPVIRPANIYQTSTCWTQHLILTSQHVQTPVRVTLSSWELCLWWFL